ncbi:sporulation integral membrane protein YtvI [Cohnella fermenti]|uniref:Sporulation integral membrane protein YtvI n=1 Tax=Cohnella fermenti TaxID=2565925 RepID=A0A4S4C312_9BACL|nr:sporulation integral membrane protein YtvI [Cohnella fermenti]THF79964.1 sporulation integral membrane protein YtvI [Cohnella fermenti]
MFSLYQKYWRTAFDIAVVAFTVWLVMFIFSYLYHIATPVFLSFAVFFCIEPLAKRLHRIGIRKAIASGISVLLFTLVLLGALAGLGFIFYSQINQLIDKLPQYQQEIAAQINNITAELQKHSDKLPSDITEKANEAIDWITNFGTDLAVNFLNWLVSFLTSFSSFIVNFGIAIILAYFLSVEIDSWRKFANDRFPRTLKTAFEFLRFNVFRGIGAYFSAQAKLISITFIVIFIALLLLNVKNAFAISLLAGVFDVLPLLGVSTLFIPWIIYLLIFGNTALAIWLSALLLVVTLTRQFLEPRITGQTIGVSAFTMLAFMMVSLSFFGVIGLILAPVLMILLKALYDQGYLMRWIRLPREEFDISPLEPQPATAGSGDGENGAQGGQGNGPRKRWRFPGRPPRD